MTRRAGRPFPRDGRAVPDSQRASYKGYFQDDELNNISLDPRHPAIEYAKPFSRRDFSITTSRVGHFYYREMSLLYGLDFPKYLP